jgi:hypothetical protein
VIRAECRAYSQIYRRMKSLTNMISRTSGNALGW